MANVERYIVTGNNIPAWLNDYANKGIVRVIVDEDGEFEKIQLELPTGRKFAKYGDVILKERNGLCVLTGEQAKKYKVIPREIQKEDKRNGRKENEDAKVEK